VIREGLLGFFVSPSFWGTSSIWSATASD